MSPKKTGKNLDDLQSMNRSLVIKLLHKKKNISRIELSKATGLERATISNIVNDFIRCGFIKETGLISGKTGHKSIALALNCSEHLTVCVRVQRSEVIIGLFDINGVCRKLYPPIIVGLQNPKTVLGKIITQIEAIVMYVRNEEIGKIIGIGFALPGPYIFKSEKILLMTGAPGWENINFREEFASRFDIPLFFEQDANCAAFAEWWYGLRSIEHGSMLFLCVGPGIGAGFIEDGHLLRGSLGIAAEVGHMSIDIDGPLCECGNRGCLELYSNVNALQKNAENLLRQGFSSMLSKDDLSFEAIMHAIQHDDPVALKALDRIARAIGFGLVNLINILNPNQIVIGDKLACAGDRLLDRIKDTIQEHLPLQIFNSLEIYLTHFADEIFLHGVNAMIWDNILNNTLLFNKVFPISKTDIYICSQSLRHLTTNQQKPVRNI